MLLSAQLPTCDPWPPGTTKGMIQNKKSTGAGDRHQTLTTKSIAAEALAFPEEPLDRVASKALPKAVTLDSTKEVQRVGLTQLTKADRPGRMNMSTSKTPYARG